jgi:hypothetical protein
MKYLKLFEQFVNEAKTLDRDAMMSWFKSKGRDFVKTSEDFNGEKSGIWLSKADNDKQIDQSSSSSKFDNGVLKSFRKLTADKGWEITFYDAETIMVWPNSNESIIQEGAVNVTPESDVIVDDYTTDDGKEIKATEIVGALVSSKTEDEYVEYFYEVYGQGAFTSVDISTLVQYYHKYLEEVNAEEVEAEESEEEGEPTVNNDDDSIEDELTALEK